jgi:alpha-glucosidase
MALDPQFFVGRAGRMVRLVVGAHREPDVPFLDPHAPRFGAAPELHVAWKHRAFVLSDDAGPHRQRGTVLTGRAQQQPLSLEVDVPDAEVLGFGAANGLETRNNSDFRVMNLDTLMFGIKGASYSSFPFFLARSPSGLMGVLLLTSFPLDVSVRHGKVTMRGVGNTEGSLLDVVVMRGSATDIVKDLCSLVGRSFLPPSWALGFHQSRWSYKSAQEVMGVAQRFRQEDLPADVIHLDIHYMDQYRVFTWDPRQFPQPRQMHADLEQLGFRTMAIVDPGVAAVPGFPVYEKCSSESVLTTKKGTPYLGHVWPGKTVFPDFSVDKVRETWGTFHQALTDAGVAGIWNDMNDPVLKMGRRYDPLDEDIHHAGGSHARMRSQYANQMAQATHEGLKKLRPGVRPFVLSRSGFLGVQRHSAMWTGDNFGSWEQLQENLHMVVNLGLCGVPLVGADVGGFGGRRGLSGGVKWRPPAELFVRWMELGALMPFFRVHCVLYAPRQEPWSFGEATLAMSRDILRRRYQLLPLLYRLALEARETGLPLVRPLWMHFDVPAGVGKDQFILGDSLLAAPVMEQGVTHRDVWLPHGAWVDLHTRERLTGGRTLHVEAPLGRCPIYKRAGFPLFTAQPGRNAEDTLRGPLILDVEAPEPGDTGRGSLFLDEGQNDDGRRFILDATVEQRGADTVVNLERLESSFTPVQTELLVRVPPEFRRVTVDGAERSFDAEKVRVPMETRKLVFSGA